jgi:hypothetical protein
MANDGRRTPKARREEEARDRAAHGQSAALGDTGDGQTGVDSSEQGISNRVGDRQGGRPARSGQPDSPPSEAGRPPAQQQERTSLDSASQTGRSRDEGDDVLERTGAQSPPRSDPEAVRPLGAPKPGDNTM